MQSFGEVGEESLAALLYTEQASESLLQFLDRTTACVAQKIVQRPPDQAVSEGVSTCRRG